MFETIEFRFLDFQKMIIENIPFTKQDIKSLIDFCRANGKFVNMQKANLPPLKQKICQAFEVMQDDPHTAQQKICLDYSGNLINTIF